MVIDLKDLKQILEEEIVAPMDHRFLNYEVKPFDTVVPTAENVAHEIWRGSPPAFKELPHVCTGCAFMRLPTCTLM